MDSKNDILHPVVYPNPSSNIFNFKFNNVNKETYVSAYIFDINGFPVKKIEKLLNVENDVFKWDGIMDNGMKAREGVYLIKGFLGNELFDAKIIIN